MPIGMVRACVAMAALKLDVASRLVYNTTLQNIDDNDGGRQRQRVFSRQRYTCVCVPALFGGECDRPRPGHPMKIYFPFVSH